MLNFDYCYPLLGNNLASLRRKTLIVLNYGCLFVFLLKDHEMSESLRTLRRKILIALRYGCLFVFLRKRL